jgi:hypothetical protein
MARFHPNIVPRHTPEQKKRERNTQRLSIIALLISIVSPTFLLVEMKALTVAISLTALLMSLGTIRRVLNVQGHSPARNTSVVAALISIHVLVIIIVMAYGIEGM